MNLPDLTFGIELEVSDANGDRGDFDLCDDYDSCRGFEVKTDGSVDGDELEFVSPVLRGLDGLNVVDNFCTYAAARGWGCDDSCGYHLHIGLNSFTDLERRKVAQGYVLSQEFWNRLCPSRRDGQWCHYFPASVTGESIEATHSFDRVINACTRGNGRYVWANLSAFHGHGTIEIRLHDGTVDRREVINWIKAHLAFVAKMPTLKKFQIRRMFTGKTAQQQFEAIAAIWDDAELTEYYRRRGGFTAVPVVEPVTEAL